MNGVDLRECTHNRALQVLRQTTAPTMRLLVVRGGVSGGGGETGYRDEELCKTMSEELVKRPGKGLSYSIVERGDCAGIIIADIVCTYFLIHALHCTFILPYTCFTLHVYTSLFLLDFSYIYNLLYHVRL